MHELPVRELQVLVEELTELVSLLSSRKLWFVSESAGRIDDSFPLETAYTVQKGGQRSAIFEESVRALRIQLSNNISHKKNDKYTKLVFRPAT